MNVNLCKLSTMTSNVIYEGGLRTVATHIQSSTEFQTDAPTDNQGKGERFSPTDLVGTALASCMLTTMAIKAKHMEEALKGVEIDVLKNNETRSNAYWRFKFNISFPRGTGARRKIEKHTRKSCPYMPGNL